MKKKQISLLADSSLLCVLVLFSGSKLLVEAVAPASQPLRFKCNERERDSSRELQHKPRDSTAGPAGVLCPFLNQLWWPGDKDVWTGLSWAPSSMPGAESAPLGAQRLEVGRGKRGTLPKMYCK